MAAIETANVVEVPYEGPIGELIEQAEDFGYDIITDQQLDTMFNLPNVEEHLESIVRWVKHHDQVVELEKAAAAIHQVAVDEHRERRKAAEASRDKLKIRLSRIIHAQGGNWKGPDFTVFFRKQKTVKVAVLCDNPDHITDGKMTPHWESEHCRNPEPVEEVPTCFIKTERTVKRGELREWLKEDNPSEHTEAWLKVGEKEILQIRSLAKRAP